jgi:hypothetical protein
MIIIITAARVNLGDGRSSDVRPTGNAWRGRSALGLTEKRIGNL